MKHIRKFNETDISKIQLDRVSNNIEDERIEEGLREWIIAGALLLASPTKGQSNGSTVLNQPKNISYSMSKSTSDSGIIKINFDKEFKSGVFKPDEKNADSIKQKLGDIAKFIKGNPKKDITINIRACESQVPNIDIETGKRLPKGELANRRAQNAKSLIVDFMTALSKKGEFQGKYKIDTTTQIGTTPFKQGVNSKDDVKYTSEQTVAITVTTTRFSQDTNAFAAYGKMDERVFNLDTKHAIGDFFVRTRATKSITDAGNVDTGLEDVLFKTLNSETTIARTGVEHDGKMYLIPSAWLNSHTQGRGLTGDQFNDVRIYLQVDPTTGKYMNGAKAKEWLTKQLKDKDIIYEAPDNLY